MNALAQSLQRLFGPASGAASRGGVHVKALLLPGFVVLMLAMMVLPLPPLMLDLLFTVNIALALMVMMISAQMVKPLDFAALPSVLLVTTLMRLSLNVASTRVVLMEGHTGPGAAGAVIEAFGHFLIGGNFAVGLIVFAILVVINFVVVTKGAERIAEVGARFALDAMPGKQMAIDADLNAGLIDEKEARRRRAEVSEEADFFGSMDGASKFVRGDAMAGLLILFVTLVGGFIIGMAMHGMTAGEAARSYVVLAVGDALVEVVTSEVADDWSERWRDFHQPIDVGELHVRAPWHPAPPVDTIDVVIDPGQAFGTGAHHTTRLCLELLQELEPAGNLMDVGCGSGVLGIAAATIAAGMLGVGGGFAAGAAAGLLIAALFALALAPALFWLWVFIRRDRNPEPAWLLVRTFLWGAAMVIPAGLLEAGIESALGTTVMFLLVGLIEETAKLIAASNVLKHHEFDEPIDGLVYATAATLGFATLENALYMLEGGAGLILLRGPISTLGHILFAGAWGYALGLRKFPKTKQRLAVISRAAHDL